MTKENKNDTNEFVDLIKGVLDLTFNFRPEFHSLEDEIKDLKEKHTGENLRILISDAKRMALDNKIEKIQEKRSNAKTVMQQTMENIYNKETKIIFNAFLDADIKSTPDILKRWSKDEINTRTHYIRFDGYYTLFDKACLAGDAAKAMLCINDELDLQGRHKEYILAATSTGSLELVKKLYELGAPLEIQEYDCDGGRVERKIDSTQPLHIAVKNKSADIAKFLLSNGCCPLRRDEAGNNALDLDDGKVIPLKYRIFI